MTTSVVCNRRLSTGRRGGQLQLAPAPYRQSISCHFLGGMRWLATSTWWTQSSQIGQVLDMAGTAMSRSRRGTGVSPVTDWGGMRLAHYLVAGSERRMASVRWRAAPVCPGDAVAPSVCTFPRRTLLPYGAR